MATRKTKKAAAMVKKAAKVEKPLKQVFMIMPF